MDFFPAFLKIDGRPCLVVGGGDVAERKVRQLRAARGQVTVVSPALTPTLAEMAAAGEIAHRRKAFTADDLADAFLIIAATDDAAVNRQVAELAKTHNVPVNVVDQPALCTFIVPSMVDRSPVQIAISTGGASPVLARLLRAKLESLIPAAYGRLASLVETFRSEVKRRFATVEDRKAFWEKVLQGHVAELIFSGREQAAEQALEAILDDQTGHGQSVGEVYLVGAGPGDPDLLTFRALRLMQQADVVLYDRLVAPEILELVRRDAERIYVGKERAKHAVPQPEINQMLVDLATQGKRVLRLKGGDPFIFGRGGEEIELLAENGVPFQVVPGITAAAGCASYAGIPLTHRDYAQAVIFVTGHLKDGTMDLNWPVLAQPNQTVVFYMGLSGIVPLCEGLIGHGISPRMPAALVEQGTTCRQRVVIGDLESLPKLVETAAVQPPTLIIVGDVVRLHARLKWFEPKPDVTADAA